MQIDLSGKRAIVTGSTAGIGRAIAEGLARAGAEVVITGRKQESVDTALAAIKAAVPGAHLSGLAADLASAEGAQVLMSSVPDADILINNLGIYEPKPIFELEDADWQEMLHTNVIASARLARHYAPGMKERGWGRLVFVSSESAQNIPVEMIHYGASKAAMQAVSRGYAKALAGTGVTSNAVLPGPTRTEGALLVMGKLADERGVSVEEMEKLFLDENRPSTLLKRFATPEEVANLCVYVSSPQASATTGAALRVEGGIVESTT